MSTPPIRKGLAALRSIFSISPATGDSRFRAPDPRQAAERRAAISRRLNPYTHPETLQGARADEPVQMPGAGLDALLASLRANPRGTLAAIGGGIATADPLQTLAPVPQPGIAAAEAAKAARREGALNLWRNMRQAETPQIASGARDLSQFGGSVKPKGPTPTDRAAQQAVNAELAQKRSDFALNLEPNPVNEGRNYVTRPISARGGEVIADAPRSVPATTSVIPPKPTMPTVTPSRFITRRISEHGYEVVDEIPKTDIATRLARGEPLQAAVRVNGEPFRGTDHAQASKKAQKFFGPDTPMRTDPKQDVGFTVGDDFFTRKELYDALGEARAEKLISPIVGLPNSYQNKAFAALAKQGKRSTFRLPNGELLPPAESHLSLVEQYGDEFLEGAEHGYVDLQGNFQTKLAAPKGAESPDAQAFLTRMAETYSQPQERLAAPAVKAGGKVYEGYPSETHADTRKRHKLPNDLDVVDYGYLTDSGNYVDRATGNTIGSKYSGSFYQPDQHINRVVANLHASGGSTVDPRTGQNMAGSGKYAVATDVIETFDHAPSAGEVAAFRKKHADALSKPGAYIGSWNGAEYGKPHELNITHLHDDKNEALAAARKANQSAVGVLGENYEEIPVGSATLPKAMGGDNVGVFFDRSAPKTQGTVPTPPELQIPAPRTNRTKVRELIAAIGKNPRPVIDVLNQDVVAGEAMVTEPWFETGPMQQAFEAEAGPTAFRDFNLAGGAASSQNSVPVEIAVTTVINYMHKTGASLNEALKSYAKATGYKKKLQLMESTHAKRGLNAVNLGMLLPANPYSADWKTPRYAGSRAGMGDVVALDAHERRRIMQAVLQNPELFRLAKKTGDLAWAQTKGKKGGKGQIYLGNAQDYMTLEDVYRQAAKAMGLTLDEYQSRRWVGGWDKTGVQTKPGPSYMQFFEDAMRRTLEARGKQPTFKNMEKLFRDVANGRDFLLP